MFDVGVLVSSPMIGQILAASPKFGLPAYPTTFLCVAVWLGLTTVVYFAMGRRGVVDRPAVVVTEDENRLAGERPLVSTEEASDVVGVSSGR